MRQTFLYRRFTPAQVEDLKSLVQAELERSAPPEISPEDYSSYRGSLYEAYESLCTDAVSLESLMRENHELKNKLHGLMLEKQVRERRENK